MNPDYFFPITNKRLHKWKPINPAEPGNKNSHQTNLFLNNFQIYILYFIFKIDRLY